MDLSVSGKTVVGKATLVASLFVAALVGDAAYAPASWAQDAVVIAAGDIAHCGSSAPGRTADLVNQIPGTVLALGDLAYDDGTAAEFRDCYEPTWGQFKGRTRPVPGNHEYHSKAAAGYFSYWGEQAGPTGLGYYSFTLQQWHVVALNSNLKGRAMDQQNRWLINDLASSKQRCILAFWHHPLFSSSRHGNSSRMHTIAKTLYANKASVILAGHDHVYERFDPQDPSGKWDIKRGLRLFTVGTGGAPPYSFKSAQPNSRVRYNGKIGVLKLVLQPTRYQWQFITTDGRIKDQGRANCVDR